MSNPREAVAARRQIDDLPSRDHQQCQRQLAGPRFQAIVPINFTCGGRAVVVTRSPRNPRPQCRYRRSLPATGSFVTISSARDRDCALGSDHVAGNPTIPSASPGGEGATVRANTGVAGSRTIPFGAAEQGATRTQLIASAHAPPSALAVVLHPLVGSTTRGCAAWRFRSVRRAACRPETSDTGEAAAVFGASRSRMSMR